MKHRKYITILLAAAIALYWCPLTFAQLTNGSFETGNLTGWTSTGAVDVVTEELSRDSLLAPYQPPTNLHRSQYWDPNEGNFFASLWSTETSPLTPDYATLSQSFDAEAGDTLTFAYFFDFGFGGYPPLYDSAIATLTWSGGSVVLLEHNTPGNKLHLDENVNWTMISHILPATDTYTLEFTTEDSSGTFESFLGVDNVRVTPTFSRGALLPGAGGYGNPEFVFGAATNLGPIVNSSSDDAGLCISADALSLFFTSDRAGGSGGYDLWVTTRATTEAEWGPPANLGSTVNSAANETGPSISSDSLALYFAEGPWFTSVPRPDGLGSSDLWVTKRATPDGVFGEPVNLGPVVNSSAYEGCPSISSNGLALYFFSDREGGSGGCDLWVTTRPSKDTDWTEPVNLGTTINSSALEAEPSISSDGLVLFFVSNRSGSCDLWATTRPTTDAAWCEPVNLGPVLNSSAAVDDTPADGSMLYFGSTQSGGSGGWDLWQVPVFSASTEY